MDLHTKKLIEERARALARCCQHILNYENEACEISGVGFRWGYLLLRRPKSFLEAFKAGDLRINHILLQDAFWLHQESIPGSPGLMPEELVVLKKHNEEATQFMRALSGNLIDLKRTATNTYR